MSCYNCNRTHTYTHCCWINLSYFTAKKKKERERERHDSHGHVEWERGEQGKKVDPEWEERGGLRQRFCTDKE